VTTTVLRNRAFPIILGLVLVLAALRALPVAAMSLQALSPKERVSLAQRIVRGQVASLAPWKNEEGMVETRVTLQVAETFKGERAGEVVFHVPGGVEGDLRTVVPGSPVYEEGQDLVVLLTPLADGTLMPVGLPQGSFHVRTDKSGKAMIVPDVMSLDLDGEHEGATSPDVFGAQPLDAFLATLRQMAAEVPSPGPGARPGLTGPGAPRDVPPPAAGPVPPEPGPAEAVPIGSGRGLGAWAFVAAVILAGLAWLWHRRPHGPSK
jgi:hypothetical protein